MSDLTEMFASDQFCPACHLLNCMCGDEEILMEAPRMYHMAVDGDFVVYEDYGVFARDEVLMAIWTRWGTAVRSVAIWANMVEVTFSGESWAPVPAEQLDRMVNEWHASVRLG